MLELQSVRKTLGSFQLPELDLAVGEGEYFVLLGPSGVGKSVLLEIVAGLLTPDAGRVCWRGRDVTTCAPELRRFAIVYQDYALFPIMTVSQNIAYGLRARRTAKAVVQESVNTVAEQLNIRPLLDRTPDTLSGGEQQRVALARALVIAPELLLLDEPLSAVDLQMRRRLQAELKRIQRQTGTTFLHVTHDVDEAVMLGHRIGVMLGDRLGPVGTPVDLFRRPTSPSVAAFLGLRNIFAVQPAPDGCCKANGVTIHVGRRKEPYGHIWIRPEEALLSRTRFESSARNQFQCRVEDWELQDVLVYVRVRFGDLSVVVLITYASFEELAVERGGELFLTFKSSAVHCF